MAVKVLVEGKEKTFRVDCFKCDSRLEYKKNDLKCVEEITEDSIITVCSITCPVCDLKNLISKNKFKNKDKNKDKNKNK